MHYRNISGWRRGLASGKFKSLIAAVLLICAGCTATAQPNDPVPAFVAGSRILFQGDSITDMNRGRTSDPNHILGHSYAFLIAARYGCDFPERHLTFINRGVSGNKVSDLQSRWQADTLDLKPDILSILIGVNDLNGGVSAEEFERQYDQLLSRTLAALPNVHIVLCEPFGLPTGRLAAKWPEYSEKLQVRQAIVQKLGDKYHVTVIHFQRVFDEACKRAPANYWIWDGVHPTYSGQQLLADEWVRAVDEAWGKSDALGK
ncbi:MAG TPA: SGNH/GDSL hydrolase family protein [Tepidisphaeraceae bacterium]|jgi:lysophospholipase L1-like esterase